MKTRRVISILLSACMLIGTAGIAASAATVDAESTGAGDLAISATSNLFTTSTQTVDSTADQVTVTYYVNTADYNMLNCQWTLTYDPEYLTLDSTSGVNYSYTDPEDIDEYYFMPFTNQTGNLVFNVSREGEVLGNATKLACYPMQSSGSQVAFVTATFNPVKAGSTEVYLDLEVAQVKASGSSDEITFIKGSEIKDNSVSLNATSAISGGEQGATLDTDVKFNEISITHGEAFRLNYYVAETVMDTLENPYVVFTRENSDGTETRTIPLAEATYNSSKKAYRFTFTGINAQRAGDAVIGKIYGTKNGTFVCSKDRSYSIKKYLYARYPLATKDSEKKVIVDLLNFASAAQTHKNYKTDELCNADVTSEMAAYATQTVPTYHNILNNIKIDKDARKVTFKEISGVISDAAALKYTFTTDEDINDITLRFTIDGRSNAIEYGAEAFTETTYSGAAAYTITFKDATFLEYSKKVTVATYKDGVQVSNAYEFDVESYVSTVINSVSGSLKDVYNTMMMYSNSIAEYKAQS